MNTGFVRVLTQFAQWRDSNRRSIKTATVAVTEPYARRVLGVKKNEPLEFKGLRLKCIGSRAWRSNQGRTA